MSTPEFCGLFLGQWTPRLRANHMALHTLPTLPSCFHFIQNVTHVGLIEPFLEKEYVEICVNMLA